jgi:hypothetical protein
LYRLQLAQINGEQSEKQLSVGEVLFQKRAYANGNDGGRELLSQNP